jgi:anion-transporting  ArsA/GET3 family ATPase
VDPAEFLRASRVVIVAGKGGVGKTTVTAALARRAGQAGLTTLVVELEGRSGLPELFGQPPLGYEPSVLVPAAAGSGEVRGRTITPDDALFEYLEDHGLKRVSKRLVASGAMDVVSTAAPGIRDILVLGKVKQLERADVADVLLIDAPAAGHAITFLLSARGLLDAVRVGPVHTQAADVLELLTDPARCTVVLVTLPEETPVNELVETAFALEDRVGVSLGPVVVNGLYPPIEGLEVDPGDEADADALRAAAEFRRARTAQQEEQVARLAEQLPLPQWHLPFLFEADLGPEELDELARSLG